MSFHQGPGQQKRYDVLRGNTNHTARQEVKKTNQKKKIESKGKTRRKRRKGKGKGKGKEGRGREERGGEKEGTGGTAESQRLC